MNSQKLSYLMSLPNDVGNDTKKLFIAPHVVPNARKQDLEIMCILASWLSNGYEYEDYMMTKLIKGEMGEKPYDFVLDYEYDLRYASNGFMCFSGAMTHHNLHELLLSLNDIYSVYDSLETATKSVRRKSKYLYPDILSLFDNYDTGFAGIKSNGSHYRVNYLVYLLYYVFRIWNDIDSDRCILPCNDKVMRNASNLGIVRNYKSANINMAITITNVAKDMFEGDSFFRMYELLNIDSIPW